MQLFFHKSFTEPSQICRDFRTVCVSRHIIDVCTDTTGQTNHVRPEDIVFCPQTVVVLRDHREEEHTAFQSFVCRIAVQDCHHLFTGDFSGVTEGAVLVAVDDPFRRCPAYRFGVPFAVRNVGEWHQVVHNRFAFQTPQNRNEHRTGQCSVGRELGSCGIRTDHQTGFGNKLYVFIEPVSFVHIRERILPLDFLKDSGDGVILLDTLEGVFGNRTDILAVHQNCGDFVTFIRSDGVGDVLTGILPALITPIREDGTFLRQAAEEVIDYEFRSPISGFYINGATGEGPVLSEKTRMEMAETAVEKTRGRGKIINHIGAPDVNSAFRLAKHAAEIGCDAVSSVLPNFYFKYTTTQILDYYKRIASISGLPVVVYANGLMNQNPVDFMREVMKIEGVIGVKYTIFDYYDLHRITELNGGDINVLNGPDEMLICGLTMGADGGIGTTYNIMPGWFCELYDAYRDGQIEKARETQFRINRIIEIIRRYPTSIPAVKEVFRYRGIDAGQAAYPAKVYTSEESAALRRELQEAGVPDV